jgi:hypothetical protein
LEDSKPDSNRLENSKKSSVSGLGDKNISQSPVPDTQLFFFLRKGDIGFKDYADICEYW